jgi:hypothetical protein
MKKLYLFSALLILASSSIAQISLTLSKNALIAGDSNCYHEISYVDPGNSGPNQIWDFSKIQFTGNKPVSRMPYTPSKELAGVGPYNILLNEGGYEYYFFYTDNGFEERGFTNQEKEVSMVYSDPVLKMKFPFSFGQQFSDQYAGTAMFQKNFQIDINGDYKVNADAFGTLILPDRVIKNTLRIKIVKKGLERNMCGSTEINTVKYLWYAEGCRYPVMHLSVMEYQTGGQTSVVTRTASVNLDQKCEVDAIAGFEQINSQTDDPDVSVILFPNPFNEKLTYNYFLRKALPVTIDLYDMLGRVSVRLVKNQFKESGLHTGELDGLSYGMTPGVYYLRFTFDKKTVVSKVIKL